MVVSASVWSEFRCDRITPAPSCPRLSTLTAALHAFFGVIQQSNAWTAKKARSNFSEKRFNMTAVRSNRRHSVKTKLIGTMIALTALTHFLSFLI